MHHPVKSHKNLTLDNSFTLNIQNLSGVESDISLFRLGVFGNDVPVDTKLVSEIFNGLDNNHFSDINFPPLTNDDTGVSAVVGGLTIRFFNAPGNQSTYVVAPNTTLNDLNVLLNVATPYPTGTIASGIKMLVNTNPQPPYLKQMNFQITDSNPVGTSSEIQKVDFITSGIATLTSVGGLYKDTSVAGNGTTSMVSIRDSANLTYDELLRSQNGSVLDIKSMAYNLLFAEDSTEQMNRCMRFIKTDINGKGVTYYKCPVKDPYQFQNSIGVIDMGKKADVYTLDGETSFNYTLSPFANCNITFNYVELTNLMLLPFEVLEAQRQGVVLDNINKADDVKRDIVLEVPAETFASADGSKDTSSKPDIKSSSNNQKQSKMEKLMKNPLYVVGALVVVYFVFGKQLGLKK